MKLTVNERDDKNRNRENKEKEKISNHSDISVMFSRG